MMEPRGVEPLSEDKLHGVVRVVVSPEYHPFDNELTTMIYWRNTHLYMGPIFKECIA